MLGLTNDSIKEWNNELPDKQNNGNGDDVLAEHVQRLCIAFNASRKGGCEGCGTGWSSCWWKGCRARWGGLCDGDRKARCSESCHEDNGRHNRGVCDPRQDSCRRRCHGASRRCARDGRRTPDRQRKRRRCCPQQSRSCAGTLFRLLGLAEVHNRLDIHWWSCFPSMVLMAIHCICASRNSTGDYSQEPHHIGRRTLIYS